MEFINYRNIKTSKWSSPFVHDCSCRWMTDFLKNSFRRGHVGLSQMKTEANVKDECIQFMKLQLLWTILLYVIVITKPQISARIITLRCKLTWRNLNYATFDADSTCISAFKRKTYPYLKWQTEKYRTTDSNVKITIVTLGKVPRIDTFCNLTNC